MDADLGLAGGDLRAAERTVQLLHQVAGRAGRAEAPGRVLLQTFSPEHPVMQALIAGDLDAFMAGARRRCAGPAIGRPIGRLAALIVSAETRRRLPIRWRANWGGRRRAGTGSRCSAPRRRRWRSCAAGTGGGCC